MDGYRILLFNILLLSATSSHAAASFGCKDSKPADFNKPLNGLNLINQSECQVSDHFDEEDRSIAKGARQAMMMLYGSCKVLELPVANSRAVSANSAIPKQLIRTRSGIRNIQKPFTAVADAHYYLQSTQAESSGESCRHPAEALHKEAPSCGEISCLVSHFPPLYQYGGKAKDMNLFKLANYKTESNTLGVDCSGFISQALSVQGLQFYPAGSRHPAKYRQSFSSAEMRKMGRGKDCFSKPKASLPFKSGDLLVGPHHVAAIDTLGADPFGIEQNLKLDLAHELKRIYRDDRHGLSPKAYQDVIGVLADPNHFVRADEIKSSARLVCNDWTADTSKFKITIIHSSPDSGHLGVQREKLVPALGSEHSSSVWVTAIQERAKATCEARVLEVFAARINTPLSLNESPVREGDVLTLRHQSDRAECRVPKDAMPHVAGLDCVKCCSTESDYNVLVPPQAKIYANHYYRLRSRGTK